MFLPSVGFFCLLLRLYFYIFISLIFLFFPLFTYDSRRRPTTTTVSKKTGNFSGRRFLLDSLSHCFPTLNRPDLYYVYCRRDEVGWRSLLRRLSGVFCLFHPLFESERRFSSRKILARVTRVFRFQVVTSLQSLSTEYTKQKNLTKAEISPHWTHFHFVTWGTHKFAAVNIIYSWKLSETKKKLNFFSDLYFDHFLYALSDWLRLNCHELTVFFIISCKKKRFL